MKRDKLLQEINEYLLSDQFSDLGPNGLQVEGREDIQKVVTGVSASVELFEEAIKQQADAIIVHHGIIWNFERPLYRGGYRKRVKLLLDNDINLFAWHLPLDAHEEVGNNVQIARLLNLTGVEKFGDYKGSYIGYRGQLPAISARDIFDTIMNKINKSALIYPYGPDRVHTVGIISGGAQKEVTQAVNQHLDMYITGEVSEHILHYVKEEGIHFVAAGHHATERFGIQALGGYLKQRYGLDVQYVEVPNPV